MSADTPAHPPAALRFRRDSALRSRAARGDPAAFTALYQRHHQALYRYCRSILHNDEDARDALQSAMTRAFAALRTEERDFELRPWLFRIAHNEAISLLRRRRETQDIDAIERAGEDTLDQQIAQREDMATLRTDLAELSEQQRAALVLRELNGLGHDEIATVLGVTPAAVKAAIFDARSALHEYREGRGMTCEAVRRVLSDRDGRALRGRKLRAHLRACRGCQDFLVDLERRPAVLAAMAPPLPAAASAALLGHLLPGGKAAVVAAGGASASTAASGGIAGTLAAKVAVTAIVAAGATGGAVVATRPHSTQQDRPPSAAPAGGDHRSRDIVPTAPAAGGAPGARGQAVDGERGEAKGPASDAGHAAPAQAGGEHRRNVAREPGGHATGKPSHTRGGGRAKAHARPRHPHNRPARSPARRRVPAQRQHPTGQQRGGNPARPAPRSPAFGTPKAPPAQTAPAGTDVAPPSKPEGPAGPSHPADPSSAGHGPAGP